MQITVRCTHQLLHKYRGPIWGWWGGRGSSEYPIFHFISKQFPYLIRYSGMCVLSLPKCYCTVCIYLTPVTCFWFEFDDSNLKTTWLESHFYFLVCWIIFGTCQNRKIQWLCFKYIGPSRLKFENNITNLILGPPILSGQQQEGFGKGGGGLVW